MAQRIDELVTHQAMGQVALIDSGMPFAKRVYDLLERANQPLIKSDHDYSFMPPPTYLLLSRRQRVFAAIFARVGIDFFTLCVTQHRAVN